MNQLHLFPMNPAPAKDRQDAVQIDHRKRQIGKRRAWCTDHAKWKTLIRALHERQGRTDTEGTDE